MSDALDKFLREINRDKLRVKRPTKFVFLCGGLIQGVEEAAPVNLRDYIWRVKKIGDKDVSYVLAESAQQLYRDSGYSDLITFEEDIARIASIVLVISESAGSLAELGAFCSNPVVSPILRVLISEANFEQESFIRWGPVERVRDANRDRVGVFPWTTDHEGLFSEGSAEPHFSAIEDFITGHVDSSPATLHYPSDAEVSQFYDIMWAIFLAEAITPAKLLDTVKRIHPDLSQSGLKRKLYSLRVAKWVRMVPYGGQDYYFLPVQDDPFHYSFVEGTVDKEPLRRALGVRKELFSGIPEGALLRVRAARDLGQ